MGCFSEFADNATLPCVLVLPCPWVPEECVILSSLAFCPMVFHGSQVELQCWKWTQWWSDRRIPTAHPEVGTGSSRGAEEVANSENKNKETPQDVYFLCLSVMSLILHLPVENLPCNSVVNGSRPLFSGTVIALCVMQWLKSYCLMSLVVKWNWL